MNTQQGQPVHPQPARFHIFFLDRPDSFWYKLIISARSNDRPAKPQQWFEQRVGFFEQSLFTTAEERSIMICQTIKNGS
ncbi:MAG: hypothetical protein FWE89_02960, partial [Syntrophaceae bacterium]|nr:hypothetical protein [Syntrophaceae bacterium]